MAEKFAFYKKNMIQGADGNWYEVPVEVAAEYNRSVWKEEAKRRSARRPIVGKNPDGSTKAFDENAYSRETSLEQLLESSGDRYIAQTTGFEDEVIDRIVMSNRISIINELLPTLSREEQNMLFAVSVNMSSRSYEKEYGIPRKTFLYRKDKLLLKMRTLIEEKESKLIKERAKRRKEIMIPCKQKKTA